MLQRSGGEGNETIRAGRAEFHQRLILNFDQLRGGVAFGTVPIWIDAQRLHVDALRVHGGDARAGIGHQQSRCFERMVDHCRGGWDDAMGVHVDGLDSLTVDHDLPPSRLRL